jgi:hypothetical protein
MLNVDQATISRWERGAQMPDNAMQNRLRDLLFRGRAISDARLVHFVRSGVGLLALLNADGKFAAVSDETRRIIPPGRESIQEIMTPSIEEFWNAANSSGFFRGEVASIHTAVEIMRADNTSSYIVGSAHPVTLADGQVQMLGEGKEIDAAAFKTARAQGLRIAPLEDIL